MAPSLVQMGGIQKKKKRVKMTAEQIMMVREKVENLTNSGLSTHEVCGKLGHMGIVRPNGKPFTVNEVRKFKRDNADGRMPYNSIKEGDEPCQNQNQNQQNLSKSTQQLFRQVLTDRLTTDSQKVKMLKTYLSL